ncbi:MAG: hypothetical protein HQL54_00140 [Magnetococcales bacterium]|nr:hypothetical protein [Magnetococcales bacterium]
MISAINSAQSVYSAMQLNPAVQAQQTDQSSFGREQDTYNPTGLALSRAFSSLGISEPIPGEFNMALMRGSASARESVNPSVSGGAAVTATMSALANSTEALNTTHSGIYSSLQQSETSQSFDRSSLSSLLQQVESTGSSNGLFSRNQSAVSSLYNRISTFGQSTLNQFNQSMSLGSSKTNGETRSTSSFSAVA